MDQIVKQDGAGNDRSMRETAKKLLQKTDVDKLPTLPHVLLPLLKISQHESLSYEDLAELLYKDPALYLKTLSIGHQTGFKLASDYRIETLLESLGINTIKGLTTISSASQFFSRTGFERTEFIKQHWKHSLLCACIAEAIAEHAGYHDPVEARVAGLVHDIGQLVLENAHHNKYTSTFAQLNENDDFHDLESDEFGTTHQHVGAELILKHTGNRLLADAVLYHHETPDKLLDAHPLVKIVNLANQLSSTQFNPKDHQVFECATSMFGISRPLLIELYNKSMVSITSYATELEIDLDIDGMDSETAKHIQAKEELKHIQLAEQIKNIALLDGLHQHLSRSHDEKEHPSIIAHYTATLFNVSNVILFMYDAGSDSVQAISTDQSQVLTDFRISLKAERSIITDALLQIQALHSFCDDYENPTVIDRQIIGLTNHEGLACLPLILNNTAIGVLVLGIDEIQQHALWRQLPLLNHFAGEISHTLSATRAYLNEGTTPIIDQGKLLESRIREVVHEVNNPLSIINNYLEILGYKLEAEHPAQSEIATIKSEIHRVGSIVQRLNEPTPDPGDISKVDINALIADLSHIFQTSLFAARDIRLTLELDDRIRPLHSNADALKQIYTNLIKNAVEALPANGQIMVYTQDMVNVDGLQHLEISVADDGPGIDATILGNLFSPVNSTKGEDHAGLGLSIVRKLVNELQGSISCRSSKSGTSFHILLPKK